VAAGAAAVLGGAGIGVAQASSSSPTVAPSSTSSTGHGSEARGRIAEGETHARHTGVDDPATHDVNDDNGGTSPSPSSTDDHGSGGHGADD